VFVMGWLSRRKQRKERDRRIEATRKQLPGSTERIEKALTLPITGKRNPFLDRLDPAKEIKPMMRSSRLPLPKPGEKNPFLTDDGQLKQGIAPRWEASVEMKLSDSEVDTISSVLMENERDYEYMMESNKKHAEWVVNSGRDRERYEQIKRDADTRQSWILC